MSALAVASSRTMIMSLPSPARRLRTDWLPGSRFLVRLEVSDVLLGDAADGDFDGFDLSGEDLVEAADGDEPAVDEDCHPVADEFDILKNMGGEEDGLALLFEAEDDVAEFFAADGIEAAHGFVEDEHGRIVEEGLGESGALEHAAGVLAEAAMLDLGELDRLQHLVDAGALPGAGYGAEVGAELEEFASGEVVVEVG